MPRNKFGGNKAKKGKNQVIERTFILKESDQEYATVVKTLGDGRFELFCNDGITRLGHIRGKMRKRVWIYPTDVVLVAMRDFDDNKVDIIHKYTPDEAKKLINLNEYIQNEQQKEEKCSFSFDEI